MKKKLLVTLGCSFTEGVGCYEPSMLNSDGTPNNSELYGKSKNRFHTFGWPPLLQKKLGYDVLWNLGKGGSANSEATKRWMELFFNKNLSDEYDVLIVWMVTFSERISFYKNNIIHSINGGSHTPLEQQLYQSYISFVENIVKDCVLETSFYLKVMRTICQLYNYQLLFFNVSMDEAKMLDSLTRCPNSLNFAFKQLYPECHGILHGTIQDRSLDTVAYCGHPNEKGYEVISERIFNMIMHEHSHLKNDFQPVECENKYLG
jgi:hypothetical protein